MKRFTPFGILLLFGFIGVVSGKFGLWFAFGIVAAIIVGVVQSKVAKSAPKPDDDTPV